MYALWREFAEPTMQLKLLVAIGLVVVECLVAIWAAESRRHWFFRGLAVWAALAVLIPIRAWEPAWAIGPALALIVTLGAARRSLSEPKAASTSEGSWRFSLGDLLLLFVIIGLFLPGVVASVQNFRPSNWLGWLATSLSIAGLAIVASACARAPRRWLDVALLGFALFELFVAVWLDYPTFWIAYSGCAAVAAVAAVAAYLLAFDRRHWVALLVLVGLMPVCAAALYYSGRWMRWPIQLGSSAMQQMMALLLIEFAFVLSLVVCLSLIKAIVTLDGRLGKALAFLALLLVTGPVLLRLGTVYRQLVRVTPAGSAPQPYVLAGENHYHRLLQLAREIYWLDANPVNYVTTPTGHSQQIWRAVPGPPELDAAIDEMRILLAKPSWVPYDQKLDATLAYDMAKGTEIQSWRTVVRSLEAEANLARTAGQPAKAADIAIAVIQLSDMLGRGGLEVDALVGHGLRRVGHIELLKVIDELPPEKLEAALIAARKSLEGREDSARLVQRQTYHDERVYGWYQRFDALAERGQNTNWSTEHESAWRRFDAMTSILLQTEISIRLYRLRTGHLPVTLADLVPQLLPELPRDPYLQPLHYRLEGDAYVLYSGGGDRKDDGGVFRTLTDYWSNDPDATATRSPGGRPPLDFDLQTLTREPPEPDQQSAELALPAAPPPPELG